MHGTTCNMLLAQGSFDIYSGIQGNAISYTVTYSDSNSGRVCDSETFSASNCTSGFCSSTFEISTSLCPVSSDINVTVFATTNLGDGPKTNPIKEGKLKLQFNS